MKKLILLLTGTIFMTVIPVVGQSVTIEKENVNEARSILHTDKRVFTEPGYDFEPNSSLVRLRNMLLKKSKRELNIVTPTSGSLPMSKFQLIVDKKGSVIDCIILESTDMSKDQAIVKFFQSGTFFESPATLNGEPCNSLGIFSIRYSRSAPNIFGFKMKFDFYPLTGTE